MPLQIQILCRLLGIQLNLRQNYEKKNNYNNKQDKLICFPCPLPVMMKFTVNERLKCKV